MRFNAQHLHGENACIAKISITTFHYCIKARSCELTDNGTRDSCGSGRQPGIYLFAATADFDKQVLWQRSAWVFGSTWANSRWVISGFMHGGKKAVTSATRKPIGGSSATYSLLPTHTREKSHMLALRHLPWEAEEILSPVARLILSSNSALIWSQTKANH